MLLRTILRDPVDTNPLQIASNGVGNHANRNLDPGFGIKGMSFRTEDISN
jgi:signal transduction histidine kinase